MATCINARGLVAPRLRVGRHSRSMPSSWSRPRLRRSQRMPASTRDACCGVRAHGRAGANGGWGCHAWPGLAGWLVEDNGHFVAVGAAAQVTVLALVVRLRPCPSYCEFWKPSRAPRPPPHPHPRPHAPDHAGRPTAHLHHQDLIAALQLVRPAHALQPSRQAARELQPLLLLLLVGVAADQEAAGPAFAAAPVARKASQGLGPTILWAALFVLAAAGVLAAIQGAARIVRPFLLLLLLLLLAECSLCRLGHRHRVSHDLGRQGHWLEAIF